MKDDKPLAAFMLGVIEGAILGTIVIMWLATNMQREKAIKAGVGEYRIDRETGETWFRYGVVKEEK